ncbi:MAG: NAD(P)-dependent alcohol dehydrogenase [Rubrobacteraceae bacterium]
MENGNMRAVVARGWGGPEVLSVEQVRRPIVRERSLLVRVGAAGINPLDWRLRQGHLRPITAFKRRWIPGRDVAGEVVAVGEKVEAFGLGDRVYAMLDGLFGGYAEYAVVGEEAVAPMPAGLSYGEAAAIPLASLTAVQALRGSLRDLPHDCDEALGRRRVLVNGASGGVGTFAVQFARVFGAEVTGVCSARNAGLVEDLGAHHVVDYGTEDFNRHEERYDVIFDVVGNSSFNACRRALRPGGIYVTTELRPNNFLWQVLTLPGESRKARVVVVKASGRDLSLIQSLFDAGKVRVVLDRTYPLEEAAAAQARGETARAGGKIVLEVGG